MFEDSAAATRTEIVAAEFLAQLFVAMHDAAAAFHFAFGRIAATAFAEPLKMRRLERRVRGRSRRLSNLAVAWDTGPF